MSPLARSLSFMLISLSLLAQAPPQVSTKPDYSKEGAVYELLSTKAAFNTDGTETRTTVARIHVQSDAGVQKFGVINFSYQASVESMEITYVRVVKPDGTVVTTPAENSQDMPSEVTRVAPFYSDLHEKQVAVKGLSAGDTLEYECRWTLTKPLAPGQFWLDYNFNDDYIVLDERLEVAVPKQRPIKFKSASVTASISEGSNSRTYTWKTSNLKSKVETNENKTETLVKQMRGRLPQPDVRLSSFQSWEEVGRWYSDLQKDRVKPTPEIAAKAVELTKDAADDDAKLRAIYRYVSTQFRYIGVSFGIGRYQPHSASEVLANQYGDCKDKHTLLAALLATVGIKAYPALIDIARDTDSDVPSPLQFDHVISAVPRGKDLIWLDTTAEVAPFGFLFSPLLNKHVLLMTDDKPAELVSTPKIVTKGATMFHIVAKLDDSGTLEGKVEREVQGSDQEVMQRQLFRRIPLAQWKDLVQQISYQSGFAGEVSDVAASKPEVTDQGLHYSYTYKRKDFPDWTNRKVSPPLPPILLPDARDKEKKATEPIWLGIPQEFNFDATVEVPKGYRLELPETINLVYDFAEYHSIYGIQDGKLTTKRQLIIKLDEVPSKEEDKYDSFQKAVSEDHQILVPASSINSSAQDRFQAGTMAAFQSSYFKLPASTNSEALGLEGEARNAIVKNDMPSAIDSLEHAVALDSKFARAWLMLGTMYMSSSKHDEGLDAFQKAIDIDPKEVELYKVAGFTLMSGRNYDDAVEVWQDLIDHVPENADGPANLGGALIQLKRYPEAVKALESAVKLSPKRFYVQSQLGFAYMEVGMAEKGMDAFHKAMELEPGPVTMNDIAYMLADANLQLPEALKYAEQAVKAQEEESGKLQLATLQEEDLRQMVRLGVFWDTLGWTQYKMGDLAKAETTLRAAWVLSQHPAAADHLGQLYEQQHKTDAARQMYQLALGASSSQNGVDVTAILERMAKLGKPAKTLAFGQFAGGDKLSAMRTAKLLRLVSGEANAEFFLLFSAPVKVEDAKFISGSEKLKSAVKTLMDTKFDLPFPENSNARLVRRGILSCYPVSGCSFVFYTTDRIMPVN